MREAEENGLGIWAEWVEQLVLSIVEATDGEVPKNELFWNIC